MVPIGTRTTDFADALRAMAMQWNAAAVAGDAIAVRALGRTAVEAAQRVRAQALVAHARRGSPFYRERWRALPEDASLASLPAIGRAEAMASFDAWCTDRSLTRREVDAFLADRGRIGARFRGRYLVWQSSGTSGTPGIFVQDEGALATYDALVSLGFAGPRAAGLDWGALVAQGGRAALVAADGDHFASIAAWRRTTADRPWLDLASYPVTLPLPQLVHALNRDRPALLASYPTVLALLADEQAAGRLRLRPALLWCGGEVLSRAARRAIVAAFGCPLVNEYGASECLAIAQDCDRGRLHVHADWVVLEPVDAEGRAVPAGTRSHTTLVTNLANYVQPIVRYDLGDRIRVLPDACACGSPLPAIEVEGRSDDVLTLRARDGSDVRLVPLALATVVEEAGVLRFQLVQRAADRLGLRLRAADRGRVGRAALAALTAYLDAQGLANVRIALDEAEPLPHPRDGKLRAVVGLPGSRA